MRRTLLAWFIFFGGFSIEMGVDHFLRIQDGDAMTGGIPETLWFLIQIALSVLALSFAYMATKPLHSFWKRAMAVGVQGVIGFFIYALIGLYYVGSTGIDSL